MSKWGRLGIVLCLLLSTEVWASIGKVSLLKGDAAASRDNQTIKLENNAPIEEHDKIVTGNNSQIQLTFEDKTVITLGSSSVLDIQDYLNDAQQPKAKFKFNQGTFKSITGEIGKKAPENFNLETKTATIGIRGTTVAGAVGTGGPTISLLPEAGGTTGQIAITNNPAPPSPPTPDTIACLTGLIVVGNQLGSVVVQPGQVTFVSPTQAPPPPVTLTPAMLNTISTGGSASGGQQSGTAAPAATTPSTTPTSTITTTVSEVANTTLQQSTQNSVTSAAVEAIETSTSTPTYPKGMIISGSSSSGDYYLGRITELDITIPNDQNDYMIGLNALTDIYALNTTTNKYQTSVLTTFYLAANLQTFGTSISNTSFYKLANADENDIALISNLVDSSYSGTLYYDDLYEILIGKIYGYSSSQTFLIGNQSTSLPSDQVLYYVNYDTLFYDNMYGLADATSIAQDGSDAIALAINTSNRKALGMFVGTVGSGANVVQITIGKVDANNNLSLQTYYLNYVSNTLTAIDAFSNSGSGAIYGSYNQALAVNGIQTDYMSSSSNPFMSIALLSDQSINDYQNAYSTHETLSGTIINSNGTISDLSITLNKSAGTVSVTSSPLTISSANSAFISDDYFAALSTTTSNGATVLKDYLIAIPVSSDEDDYVSWGYWGSNTVSGSSVTANTAPFSTWVAGVKTPASVIEELITSQLTYAYAGSIIGSAYESGTWGYIINSTSSINLYVNFSSSTPISGTLSFSTSNGGTWSSTITSTGSTLTASSSSFTANLVSTPATANAPATNSYGSLQGNFYGSSAQTVAGSFSLTSTANAANKAIGSFKAAYQLP